MHTINIANGPQNAKGAVDGWAGANVRWIDRQADKRLCACECVSVCVCVEPCGMELEPECHGHGFGRLRS